MGSVARASEQLLHQVSLLTPIVMSYPIIAKLLCQLCQCRGYVSNIQKALSASDLSCKEFRIMLLHIIPLAKSDMSGF